MRPLALFLFCALVLLLAGCSKAPCDQLDDLWEECGSLGGPAECTYADSFEGTPLFPYYCAGWRYTQQCRESYLQLDEGNAEAYECWARCLADTPQEFCQGTATYEDGAYQLQYGRACQQECRMSIVY